MNNINIMPKTMQKWRQKKIKSRIAIVNEIDIVSEENQQGYVWLEMPWTDSGVGGRSLDTFLKQYEFFE